MPRGDWVWGFCWKLENCSTMGGFHQFSSITYLQIPLRLQKKFLFIYWNFTVEEKKTQRTCGKVLCLFLSCTRKSINPRESKPMCGTNCAPTSHYLVWHFIASIHINDSTTIYINCLSWLKRCWHCAKQGWAFVEWVGKCLLMS